MSKTLSRIADKVAASMLGGPASCEAAFNKSWMDWWRPYFSAQYNGHAHNGDTLFASSDGQIAPDFFNTRLEEAHFIEGSAARNTLIKNLEAQITKTQNLLDSPTDGSARDRNHIREIFTATFGKKLGGKALANFEAYVATLAEARVSNVSRDEVRDAIFHDVNLPHTFDHLKNRFAEQFVGVMVDANGKNPILVPGGNSDYMYVLKAAKEAYRPKKREGQVELANQHMEALLRVKEYLGHHVVSTKGPIPSEVKGEIEGDAIYGKIGGLTDQVHRSDHVNRLERQPRSIAAIG